MLSGRSPCRYISALSLIVLLPFAGYALPAKAPSSRLPQIQPRAGEPLPGISQTKRNEFEYGKKQFRRILSAAEGLGPVFNDTSCGACHGRPEANASIPLGGASIGLSQSVRRFGSDQSGNFDPLTNLGGSLLQAHSINFLPQCQEVIPAQANVISARLTTPTFGAGLVESIPDNAILAGLSNPTVSGMAQLVYALEDRAGSPQRVGRFGWKSQVATVLSFSADASLNELGLTNRYLQAENAPQGNQAALATCDSVADPEDQPGAGKPEFIDAVTSFQRYLAAPPQSPKKGMRGEVLFTQVGCTDCHTPKFTTKNSRSTPPALRAKKIQPYSDFLLHDMGAAGDGIVQGASSRYEMRTPPLWGLALRNFFWHDGSQFLYQPTDLDTIVLGITYPWGLTFHGHNAPGSESALSAVKYGQLSTAERTDIFAFLKSLGRPEFDLAGFDHRVDRQDIAPFKACLQSGSVVLPDDACAVADINADTSINGIDKKGFVAAYQEPQFDCDCDGKNDLLASINGLVADVNSDGYPDSCKVSLQLSIQPSWPAQSWDTLKLGQAFQATVSGANPGDSIYILVSFSPLTGTSSGVLPAPYGGLCVNIDTAQNFSSLVGGPPSISANTYGSGILLTNLPSSAPFAAGKIKLQAFAIGAGSYLRSPVITQEIE